MYNEQNSIWQEAHSKRISSFKLKEARLTETYFSWNNRSLSAVNVLHVNYLKLKHTMGLHKEYRNF